jgi:uncharacterized membrane protein (DUF4010 family)
MENLDIAFRLLLAFIIGGVIGLEREINEKKSIKPNEKPFAIIGVRSSALIGALGALSGYLYTQTPLFAGLITAAFIILLMSFYVLDSKATGDFGITTELAILYSFVLGVLLSLAIFPIQIILAITIVLMLFLSRKEEIKNALADVKRTEIDAFISYAVIALVILPFLPNQTYSLSDIPGFINFFTNMGVNIQKLAAIEAFNPFKIWLIVALITGVDVVGYVLERTIGQKRGWILTSIAGGFISSTATTQSLAQESTQRRHIHHLLAAALLANLVSFFQIAILIGSVNAIFLIRLLPTLFFAIVAALGAVLYFMKVRESENVEHETMKIKTHEIFNIGPALKFALLFLVISIISKVSLVFFGDAVFLATTAIGSLVGLDAVMINTAELALQTIDIRLAIIAFILANAVNLYAKTIYSFIQGRRDFAIKFCVSVTVIVVASFLGLFFV